MGKITGTHNLAVCNPALAKEWHPLKNGDLLPQRVAPVSSKKVWWLCSSGHVWEAKVANRSKGKGCPICANKKVTRDNSLAVSYPKLVQDWHPTRNGNLTPYDVVSGTHKKVWWRCERGHEWCASVVPRTKGVGCPFCANRAVSVENSLSSVYPSVAKEWHPVKNHALTSKEVSPGSNKRVWWICARHHEWQAVVYSRTNGSGCPYCAGNLPSIHNSLRALRPGLVDEWHPIKNNSITPDDVTVCSGKKVWWRCPHQHEWQSSVANRAKGAGCPYCANKSIDANNSLQALNFGLAKEWHPHKNHQLTPKDVAASSSKKVWWICKKGHEWEASINNRARGRGCPYCSPQTSYMELRIYAELKSIFDAAELRRKICGKECDIYIPELNLALEIDGSYWHRNKSESDLLKNMVLQNHGVQMLRVREFGLKKISKHDVVLEKKPKDISVIQRVLGAISCLRVIPLKYSERIGRYIRDASLKNDQEFIKLHALMTSALPGKSLAELYPRLLKEWHPIKNGELLPQNVSAGSNLKAWWKCAKGHDWLAVIANRTAGKGCPFCSHRYADKNTCLASMEPTLAAEWHPSKNGNVSPYDVSPGSHKSVWWLCVNGHEWQKVIKNRGKCPICARSTKTISGGKE